MTIWLIFNLVTQKRVSHEVVYCSVLLEPSSDRSTKVLKSFAEQDFANVDNGKKCKVRKQQKFLGEIEIYSNFFAD